MAVCMSTGIRFILRTINRNRVFWNWKRSTLSKTCIWHFQVFNLFIRARSTIRIFLNCNLYFCWQIRMNVTILFLFVPYFATKCDFEVMTDRVTAISKSKIIGIVQLSKCCNSLNFAFGTVFVVYSKSSNIQVSICYNLTFILWLIDA